MRLKSPGKILFGSEKNFILEERMLLTAVVIGIFVSFIGGAMNLLLGYSFPAMAIPVVLAVFLIYLYYLIRAKRKYAKLVFPLSIICFLGLGVIWIFNAGYNGTNTFVLYTAFVLVLSISPSRKFLFLYILFISLLVILHFIHYLFPSVIVDFPDEKARFADTIVTIIYTSSFIYMMISFLIRNYRNERQKSSEAGRKLEELNQQLMLSNASKDRLFSIIAHDLKSPFNTILAYSEMALNELENNNNAKSTEAIEHAISSTQRTLILLDNLLLWARTQGGQIEFQPGKLSLKAQVDEVLDSMDLPARIKNISLIYFEPEEISVFADKNMLQTILRNLINNAIKYSNSGGKVRIYARSFPGNIEITVSDNGIGMSPETFKSLFMIEGKKPLPGTANEIGSGLGLILCRDFIEANGGTLRVESEPEKGSRFIFTLPAKDPKS